MVQSAIIASLQGLIVFLFSLSAFTELQNSMTVLILDFLKKSVLALIFVERSLTTELEHTQEVQNQQRN